MPPRTRGRRRVATGHLTVEIAGEDVPVTVIRSARRRRTIAISVGANGVRVQAPMAASEVELLTLLHHRAGWIARRLQAARHAPGSVPLEDGSVVPFRGEQLTLCIQTSPVRRPKVTRRGDQLLLELPASTSADDRSRAVHGAIEAWCRAQAAEVLSTLARYWSGVSALTPARVLVRNQRRRWGSCAPDGTIRLNWRVVLLDPRLADYVVVHELAHLRHRHHQSAFWEEVARHIPDHRERRRELNATRVLGYGFE